MKRVIFDTGLLVAWLCPRDKHHSWVRQAFGDIYSSGLICEAVLTEVCHLVAREGIPRGKVIDLVLDGGLQVVSLSSEFSAIRNLLNCYADTPMDFADACVTRLAEIHNGSPVCTTDTDFLVYRKNRIEAIPVIAPFSE
jgi:predicted nucleic acid-binding protein